MPQMQQVQNPGSMGLYMGLAQAGMSAVSTFAQFSPKGPDPQVWMRLILEPDNGDSLMSFALPSNY